MPRRLPDADAVQRAADRLALMQADAERIAHEAAHMAVPTLSELADKLTEVTMAGLPPGTAKPRHLSAVHNKIAVERMSRDGMRVADIAREVGLSQRHVVALRAQMGVGRRR